MICRIATGILLMSFASAVGCGGQVESSSPNDSQSRIGDSSDGSTILSAGESLLIPAPPGPEENFSNLDEALSVLRVAAEANDSAQAFAAGDWIRARGSEAIGPLVDVINDNEMPIRFRSAACRPLALIGAPARQALIEITYSDEQYTRRKAISSLSVLKPVTPEVIDRLIELFDHDDELTQLEAVRAIGHIGEEAFAAAERLEEIRRNLPEGRVRAAAYDALHQVEPRTGLQSLND